MMYYDRRLEDHVLDLLKPTGPLHWLIRLVKSSPHHRLDFRNAPDESGAVQLYVGRTSPIKIIGHKSGRKITLVGADSYKSMSPSLFRITDPHHKDLENEIRKHINLVIDPKINKALKSFTEGEAESHMGMMRRFGLFHRPNDPLIAVDSEIEIGFRPDKNGPYKTGTEHKNEDKLDLERAIPSLKENHKKLDTVGVLPTGDLALIEVKDEVTGKMKGGDILCALEQLAVHVYRFNKLISTPGYDIGTQVKGMIAQKGLVGLLPSSASGILSDGPKLIPVIAAPDKRAEWAAHWTKTLMDAVQQAPELKPLLHDLRFWCLSPEGDSMEEVIP
jgi:hypothetical protein